MAVRVLLFGKCAEWAGKGELRLKAGRPRRLGDLARRAPELALVLRRRKRVRVAVNGEFAGFGSLVRSGDEVAFMTAFSGG